MTGLKPAPSACIRASGAGAPKPGLHELPVQRSQPLTGARAPALLPPSLCSILCNCVLTPRESSLELARLEAITRAYQVREEGHHLVCSVPPPSAPMQCTHLPRASEGREAHREGKSCSGFEGRLHHLGPFLCPPDPPAWLRRLRQLVGVGSRESRWPSLMA